MSRPSFSRRLWYDHRDGDGEEDRRTLIQTDLPEKPESIVVLGEAGMGKTELLQWLGTQPGHVYCTARRLRNAGSNPSRVLGDASTLVIDALDELSTKDDGDAVDLVLQKLADLGSPRFVLSCRISDWRNVTSKAAIKEQYPDLDPLVVHLQSLDELEIRELLTFELDGDVVKAEVVMDHLSASSLAGLMENPQTLQMLARVAKDGPLPKTKTELFTSAAEILQREHSNAKYELQPDAQSALDAAGAAFAALILTGSEAIVVENAQPDEFEMPFSEAAAMPGASHLRSVLGSRLFGTAAASNRLTYWHRSIGEYLGARWLARQANTAMKRKRLLALFHSHGVVPASLRGLHAWLPLHSGDLAADVINADPSGVIEYGDAGALTQQQTINLLDALERTAAEDQRFVAGTGAALAMSSLMRAHLESRARNIITSTTVPFGLRVLLIEAIAGSELAESLRNDLRRLVSTPDDGYAIRWAAFASLQVLGGEDWPAILREALPSGKNGPRMAADIVKSVGATPFTDQEIVSVAIQYARQDRRMAMQFSGLEASIPDARLEGALDALAQQLGALGNRHDRPGNYELTDMGFRLIERRLALGPVEPARLWNWLRHFDADIGYRRETRIRVHDWLRGCDEVRRGIQRLVLLEEPGPKTVWQRAFRATTRSAGLSTSEEDIVWLLASLNPQTESSDDRWQDLVRMTPHSPTEGVLARRAALRFVGERLEMENWLEQLAVPRVQDWELDNARRARREDRARALRWERVRREMSDGIHEIRQGQGGFILGLAEAYLNCFHDLHLDATPIERLNGWVGPEITAAALVGFEAFLHTDAAPTSRQMAESNAESRRWNFTKVIVAALAERVRVGAGFHGVPEDRLISGFFELRDTGIQERAKLVDLQPALESEMRSLGLFESALRLWIEPQLEKRRSNVDQLDSLMHGDLADPAAADLAEQWLTAYPDMALEPEATMIDRLIESRRYEALKGIANSRLSGKLTDERRRNWDSASFVGDFDAQRARLSLAAAQDPKLLWSIRRRAFHGRNRPTSTSFNLDQLVWIFSSFRGVHPVSGRPENGWTGSENPWDATDFLVSLANRLAAMTSVSALEAMRNLRDAPEDSYTATLRVLFAEQRRKVTEEVYRPPTLSQVRAIVEARPPETVVDLQATLLELLGQVQRRIVGDPADPWQGFFQKQGMPFNEERCRDHLLTMLSPRPEGIELAPEGHLANDNRADISATLNGMRMPVEIKGQWHKDVWHAADTQLDRLYASDYAAERRGIYLVLWFGSNAPPSKQPRSSGKGKRRPTTATELKMGLVSRSRAALEGRVEVVVLEIEQSPR